MLMNMTLFMVSQVGFARVLTKCLEALTASIFTPLKSVFELRKKVSSQIIIEPITINTCPQCKSDQIVRHGIRHDTTSMEPFNAIPVTIGINALQPTWVSKRCMQHLKSLLLRCNCILLGNLSEMSKSF